MAGVKGRSGGRRAGSGRKPVAATILEITGGKSRRPGAGPVGGYMPVAPRVPVECPMDVPPAEMDVWRRLAPLAVERGTLTAAEVDAFADLCEAIVVKAEMLRTIRADGMMQNRLSTKMDEDGGGEQVFESKAHPLIAKWTALMVRVEAGRARFLVNATGKPSAAAEAPVANPLDRFMRRAR